MRVSSVSEHGQNPMSERRETGVLNDNIDDIPLSSDSPDHLNLVRVLLPLLRDNKKLQLEIATHLDHFSESGRSALPKPEVEQIQSLNRRSLESATEIENRVTLHEVFGDQNLSHTARHQDSDSVISLGTIERSEEPSYNREYLVINAIHEGIESLRAEINILLDARKEKEAEEALAKVDMLQRYFCRLHDYELRVLGEAHALKHQPVLEAIRRYAQERESLHRGNQPFQGLGIDVLDQAQSEKRETSN